MAAQEFWANVRRGLTAYQPKFNITDASRIERDEWEAIIRRGGNWLTRQTVQGFDAKDFAFLPDEERALLESSVTTIANIARLVHPRGPATPEQQEAALLPFLEIVETLELDRFYDAEAFRVGKTIEQDPFFPSKDDVLDIRYRTKIDSMGLPGIKIMAYLPDTEDEEFLERVNKVREILQSLVFDLGQPFWPYVSFRVMSSLQEVQLVGADE
jgi:hypothetical protein